MTEKEEKSLGNLESEKVPKFGNFLGRVGGIFGLKNTFLVVSQWSNPTFFH